MIKNNILLAALVSKRHHVISPSVFHVIAKTFGALARCNGLIFSTNSSVRLTKFTTKSLGYIYIPFTHRVCTCKGQDMRTIPFIDFVIFMF